jgi:hypothetical protein
MHEEPVSFYNQYEKDVSMGLPSTQKSEEMVAGGKPPAPKIRSPDIGVPIDNKIVKPVSSSFDSLFHTDCRMKQAPRACYYRDRDSSYS